MSDIVIKGMGMPKTIYPLVLLIYSDGSVDEIVDSEEINAKVAKAIELPPHGRLIDENDLYIKDTDGLLETDRVWNAPTILEASNG